MANIWAYKPEQKRGLKGKAKSRSKSIISRQKNEPRMIIFGWRRQTAMPIQRFSQPVPWCSQCVFSEHCEGRSHLELILGNRLTNRPKQNRLVKTRSWIMAWFLFWTDMFRSGPFWWDWKAPRCKKTKRTIGKSEFLVNILAQYYWAIYNIG